MPKDEERSRNGRDDGSNGELTEALVGVVKGNKELLASAAISAAGAVAASKGPQLVRRLTQATEDRSEHEAGRLGEKAAEGAKQSLGGGAGIAGKALSNAIGGGGLRAYYFFTKDISLLNGPVWFNDHAFNGQWKWTTQVHINF